MIVGGNRSGHGVPAADSERHVFWRNCEFVCHLGGLIGGPAVERPKPMVQFAGGNNLTASVPRKQNFGIEKARLLCIAVNFFCSMSISNSFHTAPVTTQAEISRPVWTDVAE